MECRPISTGARFFLSFHPIESMVGPLARRLTQALKHRMVMVIGPRINLAISVRFETEGALCEILSGNIAESGIRRATRFLPATPNGPVPRPDG
jgi:hypothetical protein